MSGVLAWAAGAVGGGARVLTMEGLRDGRAPWRLRLDRGGGVVEIVLRVGSEATRGLLATEAAALALAEEHDLAAPRLLAADLDGAAAGRPALVTTALAGHSVIPAVASPARLRALGAAAATVHAVSIPPRPHLPQRVRPLADVDFAAQRRSTGSTTLLDAAEQRIRDLPVPSSCAGLVHGDLWQGNTVWEGQVLVGLVDWDAAGVGHPGIDLGTLRCDTAVLYGLPAATHILEGWRQITGRATADVAYWDLAAALTTPADMTRWLPVAREHGRHDLGAVTMNHRRDQFLRAALEQVGRA
jgi:aminoglycoside phosphotransferase (APT) family kinase protein